jgi:hypothetical protein
MQQTYPSGSLIQVVAGMDTGRVGTVIGNRLGRHVADTILVVFFEDNKLDICVLPEMVRALSISDADIVYLNDGEMDILFTSE